MGTTQGIEEATGGLCRTKEDILRHYGPCALEGGVLTGEEHTVMRERGGKEDLRVYGLRKLDLHLEYMAAREAIGGKEGKMYHASILAEDLPAWAWEGARRHEEEGDQGPWREEMPLV